MLENEFCNYLKEKRLSKIELLWYSAISKLLKKSSSLTLSTHKLAEYILVLYFKNMRKNPLPLSKHDYIYTRIDKLIQNVASISIKSINKLSDKDFFLRILNHSDYSSTIQKIHNYIHKYVVIQTEKGPNNFILYQFDPLKNSIKISNINYFPHHTQCLDNLVSESWNIQESHQDENKLSSSQINKSEYKNVYFQALNPSKSSKKIPIEYKLSKHKSMETKLLFNLFNDFLSEKNVPYLEADLNQFYFYLKSNYKEQNYNRSRLFKFIKKYFHPDFNQNIKSKNDGLPHLYNFFKVLDFSNQKLGFNYTELISKNDFKYFPILFSNTQIKFDEGMKIKDEILDSLSYFKGIKYHQTTEKERYYTFKQNIRIMGNMDSFIKTLKTELELILNYFSRQEIIRYFNYLDHTQLSNLLTSSNNWTDSSLYINTPYLLQEFITHLPFLKKSLDELLEETLYIKISQTERDIFISRFNDVTLELIGRKHGFTRERARQIESKVKRKLESKSYKKILKNTNALVLSKFNDSNYINIEDLDSIIDKHTAFFVHLNLLYNDEFAYYKKTGYMSFKCTQINRVKSYINSLNNVLSKTDYEEKKSGFKVLSSDINDNLMDLMMSERYQQTSQYYFDKDHFKAKSERVKFILREYYPSGIKVFDKKSIQKFVNQYALYFDKNDFYNQSTRTIGSYITRYTKIIDRGLYSVFTDPVSIDKGVIKYIKEHIEKNNLVYLETLFDLINANFESFKLRSVEEFSRIVKKHIVYPSNRFYFAKSEALLDYQNYLITFMRENAYVYSISDLQKNFPGLNSKTIQNIFNQSDSIISNRNQKYIHVNNVNLDNQELTRVKMILNDLLKFKSYIHVLDVFEKVMFDDQISMNEEVLSNSLGLFNILKFYFNDEYNFYRPLIAEKDTPIGSFKEMLDLFFFSGETVKIQDLKSFGEKIYKSIGIKEIFESYFPKYYLINSQEFRIKNSLGLNDLINKNTERIVKHYMENHQFSGMEDFDQWHLLPQLKVDWSIQLIYSIAKDNFKDVKFNFTNKSYNYMKFRIEWRS